ncbi:MAG: isopentenyl-diphosphate Delta-isomerase [Candidatus Aenigmatarchaeota archaeon]
MADSDMMILVDPCDKEVGYEEKWLCHSWPAKLHRAFSVFIINSNGEMLIHKRAAGKKTWPGFWTNACCSHPRRGENVDEAAKRRLREELGIACPLRRLFTFEYSARFDEKWGENEVDHVFLGRYDGPVNADKKEIEEWKFVPVAELKKDVLEHPEKYTPWFKIAFERVANSI